MFQGDFGLGTLNGLDGELVVLDGTPYHISAGGVCRDHRQILQKPPLPLSLFSRKNTILKLDRIESLHALNEAVTQRAAFKKRFLTPVRIDGRFIPLSKREPSQNRTRPTNTC